jgi:hypothetical protein
VTSPRPTTREASAAIGYQAPATHRDTSGSVVWLTLRHLVVATRTLVRALERGDRAGLITFADHVALPVSLQPVDAGVPAIEAALDGIVAGGRSSMFDAVLAGLALAPPDAGRSLLVLFSDGNDTASWLSQREVREAATRSGVVVRRVAHREGAREIEAPQQRQDAARLLCRDTVARLRRPAVSEILAFTSFRTSAAGRGSSGGKRIVPLLVSYAFSSPLSASMGNAPG